MKQSADTPASANAVACAGVRGNPSRSHPNSTQSDSSSRSFTLKSSQTISDAREIQLEEHIIIEQ